MHFDVWVLDEQLERSCEVLEAAQHDTRAAEVHKSRHVTAVAQQRLAHCASRTLYPPTLNKLSDRPTAAVAAAPSHAAPAHRGVTDPPQHPASPKRDWRRPGRRRTKPAVHCRRIANQRLCTADRRAQRPLGQLYGASAPTRHLEALVEQQRRQADRLCVELVKAHERHCRWSRGPRGS